ncbi:sugar transferase [Algoriphagus sp. AGSA1]|uniref:sugar transferase n=1 Tax=Algoriphagus sp. AGSA1 TaxID=2907213 RepID=UPI0027962E11|nr:sugar transferase [Algoriphagus sp. AGSA1]
MKDKLVFINPLLYLPEGIMKSIESEFDIESYNDVLSFVQSIKTNSTVSILFVYGSLKQPEFTNLLKKIGNYSFRDGFQVVVVSSDFDYDDKKNAVKNGVSSLFTTDQFRSIEVVASIRQLISHPPMRRSFSQEDIVLPIDQEYTTPIGKRLFDIVVSGLALAILSPLFFTIAVLIRIESKGPIFYKSKRVGRGWDIISFYKFRTMVADADKKLKDLGHLNQYAKINGTSETKVSAFLLEKCDMCKQFNQPCENPLYNAIGQQICETSYRSYHKDGGTAFFKLSQDPRITTLGKFLRNSSLDELPQLINVFRGDMSIVGNRPLPIYEAEKLTTDEFSKRFFAPAGITGLWQVTKRGKAGGMSEEERIELDNHYADNYSLRLDLKILLMTIPALFQKENV